MSMESALSLAALLCISLCVNLGAAGLFSSRPEPKISSIAYDYKHWPTEKTLPNGSMKTTSEGYMLVDINIFNGVVKRANTALTDLDELDQVAAFRANPEKWSKLEKAAATLRQRYRAEMAKKDHGWQIRGYYADWARMAAAEVDWMEWASQESQRPAVRATIVGDLREILNELKEQLAKSARNEYLEEKNKKYVAEKGAISVEQLEAQLAKLSAEDGDQQEAPKAVRPLVRKETSNDGHDYLNIPYFVNYYSTLELAARIPEALALIDDRETLKLYKTDYLNSAECEAAMSLTAEQVLAQ